MSKSSFSGGLRGHCLESRIAPAMITVTDPGATIAIDNLVTLPEAINSINAAKDVNSDIAAQLTGNYGTNDIIVFDKSVFDSAQTINSTTQYTLSKPMTITGPGSALLSLKNTGGLGANSRLFNIAASPCSISGMTLTGGNATTGGGALRFTTQTVNVIDMVITANKTTNSYGGGGIYFGNGTLSATRLTISSNTALNGRGGGIHNHGFGTLTLTDSTIADNSCGEDGGGLYFFSGGLLTMERSTVSGNKSNVAVFGNGGGGIYLSNCSVLITNSTISGNSTNSTSKSAPGGGISAPLNDTIVIRNSTIAFNNAGTNAGGGIYRSGSANITIQSTIIGNDSASNGPDVFGTIATMTDSIVQNTSKLTITTSSGNQLGIDPLLESALDNKDGGLTKYHKTKAGSPAIDMGNDTNGLLSDQRGLGYPRIEFGKVDVGAYETPDAAPSGVASTTNVTVAGGAFHLITVVYADTMGAQLIDVATIGVGDIIVTGPGGFVNAPIVESIMPSVDAPTIVATYKLVPPGSMWDGPDSGIYTISLANGEVFDKDTPSAFACPATQLTTFIVSIAQEIRVNATNDEVVDSDGKTSLREALAISNFDDTTTDTITFDPNVFATSQTISLTSGQLMVASAVSLIGPASGVTIDANKLSRHFNVNVPNRSSQPVDFSGMTLVNGNAGPFNGGAILNNDEKLSLTNVVIDHSTAEGIGGGGGAVYVNSNLLMLTNVTITNCSTSGTGGAVGSFFASTITFEGCLLNNNSASQGGAVRPASGSNLTVTRSTISNNSATGNGGAFFVFSSKLTIIDSIMSGNKANTASSSYGGGCIGSNLATITIRNCTMAGNSASNGGALGNINNSIINLQNCTIVSNSATVAGGALSLGTSTQVTIESTIVANNVGATAPDIDGTITSKFSLVGNTTGATITGSNSLFNVDPLIAPLMNNGGPTPTYRLISGSPCIDAGSNPASLLNDQRGDGYGREVSAGKPDMGAYEVQPAPFVAKVEINHVQIQRSRLTSIAVLFSQHVMLPPIPSTAFALKRQSDDAVPSLAATVDDSGIQTIVTLTFVDGPVVDLGSLADGRYTLTIMNAKIATPDAILDGNSDGIGGDDYVLMGTPANGLFRLFGDADGNGTVTAADFNAFRLAYGTSGPSIFDFDGDNQVSASDFNQFRLRYGMTI